MNGFLDGQPEGAVPSRAADPIDPRQVAQTAGSGLAWKSLENMYQGCIDGVCSFDPWK
jgi:hypothetical protein